MSQRLWRWSTILVVFLVAHVAEEPRSHRLVSHGRSCRRGAVESSRSGAMPSG